MWVRLGTFFVRPGAFDALEAVYCRDCMPLVRAAAGNLDCFLMENADEGGRSAVCTLWASQEDAARYEASGAAVEVVEKVRSFFASPPLLESFRVTRS